MYVISSDWPGSISNGKYIVDASSLIYIEEDSLITQSPKIFSTAFTLIDLPLELRICSDMVDSSLFVCLSKFKILLFPIISNALPPSKIATPPL